jgi:homospermidine synthase
MQATPREGLTAQLAVTEKKWGTELNWACEYTKDWSRNVASYDLVVTTRDGKETAVGSWKPAGDEAAGLSAATSIPTAQIRTIDIRETGTQEPLAITTLR